MTSAGLTTMRRVRSSFRILGYSRRYISREADAAKEPRGEREEELGRLLEDDFASIRAKYQAPKHPIVLAHGLFGFDELYLLGKNIPGIQYWRGIREALAKNDIKVITTTVPPSGSIEARAAVLASEIADKANGEKVNIIAHSMGGLDARYMISQLKPENVTVLSLTTIATPHRGSAFADFVFDTLGAAYVPRAYKAFEALGVDTGAFSQLTRKYMSENFNPKTPDLPDVRYFSYGASLEPRKWTLFRASHDIIKHMEEAANDGMVSVPSSQWGDYKGTLVGVTHLDLINWTNRLAWMFSEITGTAHKYNGIAFYLHVADMLAKEGL